MSTVAEPIVSGPPAARCTRCGAAVTSRYCADCGAPAAEARDLSVRHFLHEAALAFTDFDSAILGTFRALFARPGELTRAYLRGERWRYLPPIRVFLLCNLLYFVAASSLRITILTTTFRGQVEAMFYHDVTAPIAERHFGLPRGTIANDYTLPARAAVDRATVDRAADRYDAASEGIGKTIVVVLVPMYAAMLLVLYAGTKRYFAEHLVFATHLVALLLVLIPAVGVGSTGYLWALYWLANVPPPRGETVFVLSLSITFAVYTYLALRTVYGGGRVTTLLRTGALSLLLSPMIVGFKFLLFFVTLAWIGR